MESYERESMRRIRRNSQTLLQDLFSRGVHGGRRDTPVSLTLPPDLVISVNYRYYSFRSSLFTQIPAQRGRDAAMVHSIASLIRARSQLLLLEGPDTVEIYKVGREPQSSAVCYYYSGGRL